MTEPSMALRQPRQSAAATDLRTAQMAPAAPLQRSLTMRLAGLAGALLTTGLLLSSQFGIALHHRSELYAKQQTAERTRLLAQRAVVPATKASTRVVDPAAVAVVAKKAT